MEMRIVRRVIAGLIFSGCVFIVSGCGTVYTSPTDVRNVPDLVSAKLSIGDSRQKVRSILGDPLVDAQSHGVEVYRLSGRDLNIFLAPIPVPFPGEKATVGVLIVYDESDKIKDIAEDIMDKFFPFRITAGGFRFVNYIYAGPSDPETLIGPPLSWDALSKKVVREGRCSLVLLMGECPMEIISLDNERIADLTPAGAECDGLESEYFGAYIEINIAPGKHRLKVSQRTRVKDRDFESVLDCEDGDRVYVELRAKTVRRASWSMNQLEGDLAVSKVPLNKHIIGATGLSPILWHRGEWYGPTNPNGSASQ